MDKIVCITGESGSGKSTLAELLAKEGYNYVYSHTTRPRRFPGEKGHIFTDIDIYKDYKNSCNMIAETFFHNNYYWYTKEQFKGKGKYVCVVDANGTRDMKDIFRHCVVIFLKCNEETRINRMYFRKYGHKIKYSLNNIDREINKRIKNDRESFKLIRCDYVIDADKSISQVFTLLKKAIGES